MVEEIRKRRQKYLDSIANYVEGVHEETRDEFLYFAEQDILFLLQELEKAQEANKRYKEALETVYDYMEQTDQELTKRVILAALREPEEI